MRGKIFVVALVAVMLGSSVALGAPPIKLGINEIRSGAFKSNGDRVVWGVEAAVKEINDSGGLLGRQVVIETEDNQMKNEIAIQNVRKMILNDQCDIIIQGSSSGVAGAIAQTMPRYKKIYLCTNAEAMAITGKNWNPYVFRSCLNAGTHVKGLAKYFSEKGYKKAFLVNQDYSWGYDVAEYYAKLVKAISPGTEIVGKEFHPVFNKDFAPYFTKVKASGADYIITGNWGTDLAQLITQARSMGINVPFGTTFLDDDGVMNIVKDAGIGSIVSNMYLLGVNTPKAKKFEDTFYKSSGGKWPSFVAMEAYIGVKMYAEAVRKAGSVDTDKVIKAFEGLSWEGPVGAITMRKEDHQAQAPVVIGEIVKKTKYYDFPYVKPLKILSAEEISISPADSGWTGEAK